jgi:hypothetical protein
MNHWRDISYRNNVNRGHNDIFNVSLYANNMSPEKLRQETTTRTNSRVIIINFSVQLHISIDLVEKRTQMTTGIHTRSKLRIG